MRYWLQVKAPAGNWVDSVGTDDKQSAIDHGRYLETKGEETRVVERTDVQVWP